jgi:glutathione S-transferase
MSILIDEEYAWVVFISAVIGFQVLLQGFGIGSVRRRLFTKEFFEKNFKGVNYASHKGGYPDCGSGHFSAKLSTDDWIQFANYQRSHLNYVEGVATAISLVLLDGLYCARLAFVLGLVYVVGRAIYSWGYRSQGPGGRLVGAILLDLALLALVGHVFYRSFKLGGGVQGFFAIFVHLRDDVLAFVQ